MALSLCERIHQIGKLNFYRSLRLCRHNRLRCYTDHLSSSNSYASLPRAEPREVKDMSQGQGALAHHKAKNTGLSGFPVCASAFPHIMPEAG